MLTNEVNELRQLPLDGRPRRARIPPRWTLRLWLGFELGYWRHHDTGRWTTVGELRAALASFVSVPLKSVQFRLGGAMLRDEQTAESVELFSRTADVRADAGAHIRNMRCG